MNMPVIKVWLHALGRSPSAAHRMIDGDKNSPTETICWRAVLALDDVTPQGARTGELSYPAAGWPLGLQVDGFLLMNAIEPRGCRLSNRGSAVDEPSA